MPFKTPQESAGAIAYTDREPFLLKLAKWGAGGELLFWYARKDYENLPTHQKAVAMQNAFVNILDLNLNNATKQYLRSAIALWSGFLNRHVSLTPTQRRELALLIPKIISDDIISQQTHIERQIPIQYFTDQTLPWKSSSIKETSSNGDIDRMRRAIRLLIDEGILI